MVKISNDLYTILYPRLCFGCNAHLVLNERFLCAFCRHEIPLTDYHLMEENPVDRIFYGRIPLQKAASFLLYQKKGLVKNLLMKLKYEKQKEIGTFLGEWYGIQLKDSNSFSNIDMILPVPLHNRKKRQRGYNQVSAFGKAIAAALGKPYSEDMLLKRKSTLSQTQKGRWLRWRDPDDIFTIENPELLHSKHVLLVDDIITTGGTIEACGSVLLDCPNTKLSILSMALSV